MGLERRARGIFNLALLSLRGEGGDYNINRKLLVLFIIAVLFFTVTNFWKREGKKGRRG